MSTPSSELWSNLRRAFEHVRRYSESLCERLDAEDYVPQKAAFVSPTKWHLAHTTWFFEEMILVPFLENYERYDSDFAFLFNSYYNSMGERISRGDRGMITRPNVREIYRYRATVNEAMFTLIMEPLDPAVHDLIVLGLHHEQQHQELMLTDLKYNFSFNPTYPKYAGPVAPCRVPQGAKEWIDIPSGTYSIGHAEPSFCFDNEKAQHDVLLNAFSISSQLVRNDEYITFIEDGGYQRFDLWLEEGWAWVMAQNIAAPLYWFKRQNQWWHYTLAGALPVGSKDAVTHVNYYEAQAYASWKKQRLPTEFEWEAAAPHIAWGERWEWCQSAYLPYPGFETSEGAVGEYNGKFMINQMVLRGASSATPFGHARPTYRNFFHPEMQWQFSGIRLVK